MRGDERPFRGASGPWARWVARPLAARLLRAVDRPGVRPWHLTVAGLVAASGAALLFVSGGRLSLVGAAVLAQLAVVCDFADGALARARGGSLRGAALDGIADAVRTALLAGAAASGALTSGADARWVCAGLATFLAASLLDGALPRVVREALRGATRAEREPKPLDHALRRAARACEQRGLRLIPFGFNEREALAFCLAPLLGLPGAGLLVAGVLSLPFLALRLRLDLALARTPDARAARSGGDGLIVVGAGFWQVPIVEAAQDMGLRVVAIDRDPGAPGARLADRVVAESAHDPDAALAGLREAALDLKLVGVLSGGARGCTSTAAVLARALALPGLDPAAAGALADKAQLRMRLSDVGLNDLPFRILQRPEDARPLLEKGPIVLKPCGTSGGRGLFLLKDLDELDAVFERVRHLDPDGFVLAEGYAAGRDVGVVGIARDGELDLFTTFDKRLGGGEPFGRPGLYAAPSRIAARLREAVEARACEAARSLGICTGPFYVELRVPDDGSPQVIEVEAGVPGSLIASHLVPGSSGRDYVRACIAAVTGGPAPLERRAPRAVACRFVWTEDESGGLECCGLEDVAASGIGAARVLVASGEAAAVRRLVRGLR